MTTYSDVNYSSGTSTKEILTDYEAINQNISSIFETPIGSKWFRPNIGTNVTALLFEPIDSTTASALRREMFRALEKNGETRVVMTGIDVEPDPVNSQYYVSMQYEDVLTGTEQKFNFNIQRP